jgi:hypothetical protein
MTPALELLNLLEELDGKGTTVIELVRGEQPLVPWRLYPSDDGIFDRRAHCQFYYHSHGADHEAGHFHTVRLFADHTAHLVAISMAANGWPQALFTLNLWAIGDSCETAANLRRYVRTFRVAEHAGPGPLVRFINLMYQAFSREMERLQEEKIERLLRYRVANPGRDIFKDRSLEVLSRVEIDVRAAAKNGNATIPSAVEGEGRA